MKGQPCVRCGAVEESHYFQPHLQDHTFEPAASAAEQQTPPEHSGMPIEIESETVNRY